MSERPEGSPPAPAMSPPRIEKMAERIRRIAAALIWAAIAFAGYGAVVDINWADMVTRYYFTALGIVAYATAYDA